MNFIFHFIYGIILPIDELIFFKMGKTTNIIYIYHGVRVIWLASWMTVPLFRFLTAGFGIRSSRNDLKNRVEIRPVIFAPVAA